MTHAYTPRYPDVPGSICECGLAQSYCERRLAGMVPRWSHEDEVSLARRVVRAARKALA